MNIETILLLVGNLAAIITAVGGTILSIVTAKKTEAERNKALAETRKTDVDAASVITDSSLELVNMYNKRMDELESKDLRREAEIAKLRIQNIKLMRAVCYLINILKVNKISVEVDLGEADCTQLL